MKDGVILSGGRDVDVPSTEQSQRMEISECIDERRVDRDWEKRTIAVMVSLNRCRVKINETK